MSGPRSSVVELVLALEAPEFGRTAGSPPLPLVPSAPGAHIRVSQSSDVSVIGPSVATTSAGQLEARYVIEGGGMSALAVRGLAAQLPAITLVLAEQSGPMTSRVSVFRAGTCVGAEVLACERVVILPERPHLTDQECAAEADLQTFASGRLHGYAVLADVTRTSATAHDVGAWREDRLRCADGTTLTVGCPNPGAWTARMVVTDPRRLAGLLGRPTGTASPI